MELLTLAYQDPGSWSAFFSELRHIYETWGEEELLFFLLVFRIGWALLSRPAVLDD